MKRIIIIFLSALTLLNFAFAQQQQQIQKAKECYQQGIQLAEQQQYDKAISCLDKAAQIYKDISPINYAIINLAIANIYIQREQIKKAAGILFKIKPIIENYKQGQNKYLISLYNYMAQYYQATNQIDSAKTLYLKAIDLAQKIFGPNSATAADLYSNLANLLIFTEDYPKAKYYLQLATDIHKKIYGPNSIQVAYDLNNLGQLYSKTGNFEKALELFQQALNIFNQLQGKNSYLYAKILMNIGQAYSDLGQNQTAIEYFTRSLNIIRNLYGTNSPEIAEVYLNIGMSYYLLKQYNNAIQFLSAALNIYKQFLPPNSATIINIYNNIASVYKDLANYEMAKKYYTYALYNLQKTNPNDPRIPILYSNIGTIFYYKNNFDSAETYINKAISLLKERNIPYKLITPTLNLGYIYMKKQQYRKALKFFQQSIIANCPNFNNPDPKTNPNISSFLNGIKLLEALSNKLGALIILYKQTDSIEYLNLAFNTALVADSLIAEIRQIIVSDKDKLTFNSNTIKVYENAIFASEELAKKMPQQKTFYQNKAFYFGERNKAGLLIEAINAAKAQKIAGIPDSLINKEKSLREKIAFFENKLARTEDISQIFQIQQILFDYKSQYRNLIKFFEKNYPKYYKIKYSTNTVSINELQNAIDTQTAIISYFYGDKNLYQFVILKNNFNILKTSVENVADTILALYKNIRTNTPTAFKNFTRQSFNLFKMIFPNNIPYNIKKLIIIPDDILNIVPFEALIQHEISDTTSIQYIPFLVKSFAISYAYSSYLLYSLHFQNQHQLQGTDFLGIAPGFIHGQTKFFNGVKLSPLPGSIQEVKNIAQNFKQHGLSALTLTDSVATETNFKNLDLTKFKIIHISTHGLIFSDQPQLSALAFYKDNSDSSPDDGFLYVGEIYNLKTNASLITLSACETGLGKISKGEGVIGLSRAFFYTGTQNMIISLWKVSDLATQDLMEQMYNFLLENYKQITYNTQYAQALQKAKLALLNSKKWSHPYYWSAFILIGM